MSRSIPHHLPHMVEVMLCCVAVSKQGTASLVFIDDVSADRGAE